MAKTGRQRAEELREEVAQRVKDIRDKQRELEEFSPQRRETITRESIAKLFVRGYLALFVIVLIGVPLYNLIVFLETDSTELTLNLNDVLLTFASVIGSALGFVIGYYFKSRGDSE